MLREFAYCWVSKVARTLLPKWPTTNGPTKQVSNI
jgi:hypothetical protein